MHGTSPKHIFLINFTLRRILAWEHLEYNFVINLIESITDQLAQKELKIGPCYTFIDKQKCLFLFFQIYFFTKRAILFIVIKYCVEIQEELYRS